jgi:hypothetical protein
MPPQKAEIQSSRLLRLKLKWIMMSLILGNTPKTKRVLATYGCRICHVARSGHVCFRTECKGPGDPTIIPEIRKNQGRLVWRRKKHAEIRRNPRIEIGEDAH